MTKPLPHPIAEGADLSKADNWSRHVYDALYLWGPSERGRWWTMSNGSFLLQVDTTVDGKPCAPFILSTGNTSLLVTVRDFQLDLPLEGQTVRDALSDLTALASRWFDGELAVAAFYAGEEWQGAVMVSAFAEMEVLADAYQLVRRRAKKPDAINTLVIQTPFAGGDRRLNIALNGKLVGAPG